MGFGDYINFDKDSPNIEFSFSNERPYVFNFNMVKIEAGSGSRTPLYNYKYSNIKDIITNQLYTTQTLQFQNPQNSSLQFVVEYIKIANNDTFVYGFNFSNTLNDFRQPIEKFNDILLYVCDQLLLLDANTTTSNTFFFVYKKDTTITDFQFLLLKNQTLNFIKNNTNQVIHIDENMRGLCRVLNDNNDIDYNYNNDFNITHPREYPIIKNLIIGDVELEEYIDISTDNTNISVGNGNTLTGININTSIINDFSIGQNITLEYTVNNDIVTTDITIVSILDLVITTSEIYKNDTDDVQFITINKVKINTSNTNYLVQQDNTFLDFDLINGSLNDNSLDPENVKNAMGTGYLLRQYTQYCKIEYVYNYHKIGLKDSGGISGVNTGSYPNKNAEVIIENCNNYGNVMGNFCGGISGSYAGNGENGKYYIKNCKNYGLISGFKVGGICGTSAGHEKSSCVIDSCINYGNLYNCNDSGGICGATFGFKGGNGNILSCINNGNIISDILGKKGNGGICGSEAGGVLCNIDSCINNGNIGSNSSGGICGLSAGFNNPCNINNSTNNGEISGNGSGGICGDKAGFNRLCTIFNSTNNGKISGNGSGGICGDKAGVYMCNIFNSTNNGEISGVGSGGICGSNTSNGNNGTCIINGCINEGIINAVDGGGIVGYYNDTTAGNKLEITSCNNNGIINQDKCGGIVGYNVYKNMQTLTILKCINSGTINGDDCGGIVGSSGVIIPSPVLISETRDIKIEQCINLGTIGSFSDVYKNCGGIVASNFGDPELLYLVSSGTIETNPDNTIKSVPIITQCINRGNMINVNNSGGIAGPFVSNASIENCVNYGNLIHHPDSTVDIIGSSAGIISTMFSSTATRGYIKIKGCVNVGNLNGPRVFGICGNTNIELSADSISFLYISVEKCINYGNLNTSPLDDEWLSAGIGGYVFNTNSPVILMEITGCYNLGFTETAGISLGNTSTEILSTAQDITECYNLGRVEDGSEIASGGVLKIEKCYSIRDSSSNHYASPIQSAVYEVSMNNDGNKDIDNLILNLDELDTTIFKKGYSYPTLNHFGKDNVAIWTGYGNYNQIPILLNIPFEYQVNNFRQIPNKRDTLDAIVTDRIKKSSLAISNVVEELNNKLPAEQLNGVGTIKFGDDNASNTAFTSIIANFFNTLQNTT